MASDASRALGCSRSDQLSGRLCPACGQQSFSTTSTSRAANTTRASQQAKIRKRGTLRELSATAAGMKMCINLHELDIGLRNGLG